LHKDNLSEIIQASDKEIEVTLRANGALLIKEHWRLLGPAYICRFFELFFTTALLEDWPVVSGVLSRHAVITKFKEDFYEEFGDNHVLNHIMTIFQDGNEIQDEWKVSEEKVCRFFGDQLLRAKAHWDSSDLLLAWKKLVGEFTPGLEMLRGLAIFDGAHHALEEGHLRLSHMAADELPCNPAERFKLLFQTRARWFYDDLLPFIEGLEETEKQLQGLMLKYARFSTDQASGRKVVTPLLPP
jgi:sister chromatid cohesion protein DCC1